MKAPERACRGCGSTIPAQPSGPGRPRVFCSVRCRRDFHHGLERERELDAKAEAREEMLYARDRHFYGKRQADRRRRERQKRRNQQ